MGTASRKHASRSAHLALAVGASLAMLALPPISHAQEPSPGGDQAVCANTEPSASSQCAAAATPIEPDGAVLDPRPSAWDHIVVAGDGRTLQVYFWMGVEDCYGLHSVQVRHDADALGVTIMTGVAPGAVDRICIDLAQLYVTTVTLDAPLIVNVG